MSEERIEMSEEHGNGKAGTPTWLVNTLLGLLLAGAVGTWYTQGNARAGDLEAAKRDLAVLQSQFNAMRDDIASLKAVTGQTALDVRTLLDHDNQRQAGKR